MFFFIMNVKEVLNNRFTIQRITFNILAWVIWGLVYFQIYMRYAGSFLWNYFLVKDLCDCKIRVKKSCLLGQFNYVIC